YDADHPDLPSFPTRRSSDLQLGSTGALYLAVGIIGATVMPHAIYLHSALTKGRMPVRDDGERARVLRFERLDVFIALGLEAKHTDRKSTRLNSSHVAISYAV